MPTKKKSKKGDKKKDNIPLSPGKDPMALFNSYSIFCKTTGLETNDSIRSSLTNEENPHFGKRIIIDEGGNSCTATTSNNSRALHKPLGSGDCRALATAILGCGAGMPNLPDGKPVLYTALKELRIWNGKIGNSGASAIAEILRLGGSELQLNFLELMGGRISHHGALDIGRSLSVAVNKSLIVLMLDFNPLGSEGIKNLCRGLRTNSTLKKLSTRHCDIEIDGGGFIGEMLSFSRLALATIDLTSNRLGSAGLSAISQGLLQNKSIKSFKIADNEISAVDLDDIRCFATVLTDHPCLQTVDLSKNRIGVDGALILIPSLSRKNKRITSFLIDTNLPSDIYKALYRTSSGSNGKKKAKKKAKKKKK
mmetsp:Transcript_3578/g.3935  ORF Transcript_3578/g.3935 Transcript_3578/m.3935 type:complete len:366 (+) Transcript_3578:240-1337(+)